MMRAIIASIAFASLILANPARAVTGASMQCDSLGNEMVPQNQGPIVINNVNVFNGVDRKLIKSAQVLIDFVRTADSTSGTGKIIPGYDVGYFIKEISTKGSFTTPYEIPKARVIDGRGMTLMPGLIDAHTHLSWANTIPVQAFAREIAAGLATFSDWPSRGFEASKVEGGNRLDDGFTTIREVGGVGHLVKKCFDPSTSSDGTTTYQGIPGPRIWYAGSVISPTAGHADNESDFEEKFHFIQDLDAMSHEQREDLVMQADAFGLYKADGVQEVSLGVRRQFFKGAQFIKIATGGGISSPHDPIDATIMTNDEVAVVTQITDGMHTYATTHAYEGETILRDIKQGVQMIEHANLINDKAAREAKKLERIFDKDSGRDRSVWLDISPFFDNEYANPKTGPGIAKQKVVQKGTLDAYALVKKYKLRNVGWGADVMFESGGATKAPNMLAHLGQDLKPLSHYRIKEKSRYGNYGWSNFDILKMVTANNGEILTKSGPRTPYLGADGTYLKPGFIGVIKPNAVADLIIVDGNPLVDMTVFSYPRSQHSKLKLIMKDGYIHVNKLPQ